MRQLARAGLGILLVTHHVSEITPEIERVVILKRGQILADGPKSRVLTGKQLSALFGARARLFVKTAFITCTREPRSG